MPRQVHSALPLVFVTFLPTHGKMKVKGMLFPPLFVAWCIVFAFIAFTRVGCDLPMLHRSDGTCIAVGRLVYSTDWEEWTSKKAGDNTRKLSPSLKPDLGGIFRLLVVLDHNITIVSPMVVLCWAGLNALLFWYPLHLRYVSVWASQWDLRCSLGGNDVGCSQLTSVDARVNGCFPQNPHFYDHPNCVSSVASVNTVALTAKQSVGVINTISPDLVLNGRRHEKARDSWHAHKLASLC